MASINLANRFPDVSFGTSGVRALVKALTPDVVAAYIYAFVQGMRHSYDLPENAHICVGMDLRPSSPDIVVSVCGALQKLGCRVEFVGAIPTPALALRCLTQRVPGVMITGSHIPFDRNGIKFYTQFGEILKGDEQAISACPIPDEWSNFVPVEQNLPALSPVAGLEYVARYQNYFGERGLSGLRVGLYEHSAVGRDLTKDVLTRLGVTVISVGRSDHFVPIDTEAVGEDDLALAMAWCTQHGLDALVSTDGDGDRPLVFDARGEFIRGDILGLLCARQLHLQVLAVPVSCNTAIEKTGFFNNVVRTRIGSPYVVQAMLELSQQSEMSIGGFEANGGFLLGTDVPGLQALPTRDALLPIIAVLSAVVARQTTLHDMVSDLPARYTYSDRIKDVPKEYSQALIERLLNEPSYAMSLFAEKGEILHVDTTDGVRLTFDDGDIAHIRPSGNAPELRCYAESSHIEAAKDLCLSTLARIR
jgi:phosphomannomutase